MQKLLQSDPDLARPSTQGIAGEAGSEKSDMPASVAKPISGFALLVVAVKGIINSWFGRSR